MDTHGQSVHGAVSISVKYVHVHGQIGFVLHIAGLFGVVVYYTIAVSLCIEQGA